MPWLLSNKKKIFLFQKQCTGTEFTVQGDLVKCGVTDTETCLKSVTLALSDGTNVSTKMDWKRKLNIPLSISNLKHFQTEIIPWLTIFCCISLCTQVIKVDSSGNIEVNRIIAQMPLFTGRQIKYENRKVWKKER